MHSLGAANEAEIRSLFSALTWKDESPFTLSGRVIKRPKAPELGPDANFRRIAQVRSACRNSPRASAPPSKRNFPILLSVCSSAADGTDAKLCFLSPSTKAVYSIPGTRTA
jgi:hypothetical protein